MTWALVFAAAVTIACSFALLSTGYAAPAQAANVALDQCNGVGPGVTGATTQMNCTITVVNTINGGIRGSVTTVTRQCGLDPCPPGNGTFTTTSTDLVTTISQCNGSDNDAAHPITCSVTVTNNISAGTPGATPVTPATVNQCVGSAAGGGGSVVCSPFPATTTGATVTQCNGSGNGGGGTVDCAVSASNVSSAIPVTINQCNGTGNPGGSVVTCRASITTNITAAATPTPTPTASPSASATPTSTPTASPSASTGPSASPTGTVTSTASPTGGSGGGAGGSGGGAGGSGGGAGGSGGGSGTSGGSAGNAPSTGGPQVSLVPSGGVAAGGGSMAGSHPVVLLLVGLGLLSGAVITAAHGRNLRTARAR